MQIYIILGPMLNALNVGNYTNYVLLEGSTNIRIDHVGTKI